jgi:hypothetical protein
MSRPTQGQPGLICYSGAASPGGLGGLITKLTTPTTAKVKMSGTIPPVPQVTSWSAQGQFHIYFTCTFSSLFLAALRTISVARVLSNELDVRAKGRGLF